MSDSDGKERRKVEIDLSQMKEDIAEIHESVALLINTVEANHKSIRQSVDRITGLAEKHNDTLYGNGSPGLTSKIQGIFQLGEAQKDHNTQDKWLFSTVIGLLLFVLGKMLLTK